MEQEKTIEQFCPACEFEGVMPEAAKCPGCGRLGRPDDFRRPDQAAGHCGLTDACVLGDDHTGDWCQVDARAARRRRFLARLANLGQAFYSVGLAAAWAKLYPEDARTCAEEYGDPAGWAEAAAESDAARLGSPDAWAKAVQEAAGHHLDLRGMLGGAR